MDRRLTSSPASPGFVGFLTLMGWPIYLLLALGVVTPLPCSGQTPLPSEDIPEEILRTEIIVEGRSPVDGSALTATEYTELLEALGDNPNPPQLSPRIRQLIFLLKVRQFIRSFIPFLF